MSRIAKSIPMQAYDHVTRLLIEAGSKDGTISKADATKLVKELRADGRGTEALAADRIFKMLDAHDGKANTVTGYDLTKSREWVATVMIGEKDVNNNGLSKAEIATLATTGKALVELGQVLALAKKSGRIAKDVPEKGLIHIAQLLKEADKGDGITSRKDRDDLVKHLYGQGRGTESLAASYFFGFIDARDHKPGARVTAKDIDKAVEYAKQHMLRNKDGNNNGYSKKEIEKFSTTAKAFLLVGQMIDAGILKPAAS
jgi:hypothetical protein